MRAMSIMAIASALLTVAASFLRSGKSSLLSDEANTTTASQQPQRRELSSVAITGPDSDEDWFAVQVKFWQEPSLALQLCCHCDLTNSISIQLIISACMAQFNERRECKSTHAHREYQYACQPLACFSAEAHRKRTEIAYTPDTFVIAYVCVPHTHAALPIKYVWHACLQPMPH